MNQEIPQEIFNRWIQHPAQIDGADQAAVDALLQKFPYCQILQMGRAKLHGRAEQAAVYAPDRALLAQFFHEPESLKPFETPSAETELEKVLVEELNEGPEASVEAELKLREEPHQPENTPLVDETEQLILESIASADFFALEEKATEQPKAAETANEEPASRKEVSRYDDDQMPYTFLWWLNKTRNEHADTYQPYVSFKLDTSQQIRQQPAAETPIPDFDLSNLVNEAKPKAEKKAASGKSKNKTDDIIERFIQEEPQISPPSADKMGNENKARKSAEDTLDLVSETLAQIYTEQMLLDKAIETYRKLSLKFPEKSTYFADQISVLERRKN